MTCRDVEQLLGHFVDAELPPPMLLAVARHAASCAACDQAARELTELHDAIAHTVEAQVAEFDFSRVWPEVERRITPERRETGGGWRRLSSTPLWGGALAVAASALFFLQMPANTPQVVVQHKQRPPVVHPADKNQAFIDRLAGKRVTVRREPKSGTTMVWVNYDPMEAPN